jgi:hypothetical protein
MTLRQLHKQLGATIALCDSTPPNAEEHTWLPEMSVAVIAPGGWPMLLTDEWRYQITTVGGARVFGLFIDSRLESEIDRVRSRHQ